MFVIGYILSLFIGISLGTIGGGGSILTVPILIYCFGMDPVLATSYSLFIVGTTSLMGTYRHIKTDHLHYKAVVLFGGVSTLVVLGVRKYALPILAKKSLFINGLVYPYSNVMMVIFSLFMVCASIMMIKDIKFIKNNRPSERINTLLVIIGIIMGLVTGFMGIGGGFIIVPALVLVVNLPMREAIGTSLAIITFNTLIGFVNDVGKVEIDWQFLSSLTLISLIGAVLGSFINKKLPSLALKKIFGWFILVVGCYILLREILFHN